MIEVKSIKPFLINIDENQEIIYFIPETNTLIGCKFTKQQEKEILEKILANMPPETPVVLDESILEEAMSIKEDAQKRLDKIKELYVNWKLKLQSI